MKCLITAGVAGPCFVCGEFQDGGMHVVEEPSGRLEIYCARCCETYTGLHGAHARKKKS